MRDLQAEIDALRLAIANAKEYVANAPNATFDRSNVQALLAKLAKISEGGDQ